MGAALYDAIPYPSVPFPQTHPDRLAVLASLYGMRPAPVERCRVLELGCGDGTNLISLALGLPDTELVGVDAAAGPIARGQATVAALGLRNVSLHHGDLRSYVQTADREPVDRAPADHAPFDYIIAHGVYSWVPPDVREAVLAICHRWLTPQGVAYVSYNAYPGSHQRDMVREMLLYHAAGTGDSQLMIDRARGLARLLADAMPVADELTSVRKALQAVEARHPGALFHDELSPVNQPFYFYEVVEQAGAHGLQYLAEADFLEMQDRAFSPAVREILRAIEQERGRVAREQYLDFLKVRQFRQTLLCHADIPLRDAPTAEDVTRFLIGSAVRPAAPAPDLSPGVVQEFHSPRGGRIQVDLPLAKAALLGLGEAWPVRLPFRTLLDRAHAHLATGVTADPAGDDSARVLAEVLFDCYAAGIVQLYTHMPELAPRPGARPVASPLVRAQLERDEPTLVSTLLHTHLLVEDPLTRQTLRLLDGTRDRAALLGELRRWHAGQAATGQEDPPAATAGEIAAPDDLTPAALDAKLHEFARLGLLIA